MSGAITLQKYRERYGVMLRLACRKCDRKGQYRVDRLIKTHGARFGLPDMRRLASCDCPKHAEVNVTTIGCGAYFPELKP